MNRLAMSSRMMIGDIYHHNRKVPVEEGMIVRFHGGYGDDYVVTLLDPERKKVAVRSVGFAGPEGGRSTWVDLNDLSGFPRRAKQTKGTRSR